MATKTKRKPGRPKKERVKQGYLPDMAPPSIKEIDRAAESYVTVRDERCALSPEEAKRKDFLHSLMKKHDLTVYEYDGHIVTIEPGEETVKVKKKKEPKAEKNDNGDE